MAIRGVDGKTESWVTVREWECKNIEYGSAQDKGSGRGFVVFLYIGTKSKWVTLCKVALHLERFSAM